MNEVKIRFLEPFCGVGIGSYAIFKNGIIEYDNGGTSTGIYDSIENFAESNINAKFEIVEEKKMLNCKIKFLEDFICGVKSGTIVEFINGMFQYPDGGISNYYNTLEEFQSRNRGSKFEIVVERKMFTKKDLKVNQIVRYRNGELRLVTLDQNGDFVFVNGSCYSQMKMYNDDLTRAYDPLSDYNVMEVYSPAKYIENLLSIDLTHRTLIWQREIEVTEITMEEIAKLMGKSVESIRIKDGK